jgi:hypothetical protein
VVVGVLAVFHGEDLAVASDQEIGGKAEAPAVRAQSRGRNPVAHDPAHAVQGSCDNRRPGTRVQQRPPGRLDAEVFVQPLAGICGPASWSVT